MTSFVLSRPDGTRRNVSGYRLGAPPPGAKTYQPDTRISRIPPKVDLRPMLTEVEDQQTTNSCAANAAAGAFEYLMKRHLGDQAYDVSRLFMYFNARRLDGTAGEDEGATLTSVIEGLKQSGACSEQSWPFDPALVNDPPSDDAYAEATHFLVEDCEQVPTNLEAWKIALAAGNPIIFGLKLFASFDKHKAPGRVPLPTPRETGRESHGGHAMLCVGYSDADEVFIVRNSWGTSWGDAGYCYIPYSYVMNPEHNYGDSWIIKRVEEAPVDESAWGDDSSLLPELDTVLAAMDDDAYGAFLEALGDVAFEQRLALLFLRVAGADGALADEELAEAAAALDPVLRQAGSPYEAAAVLEATMPLLETDDLFEETLDVFGEHLPNDALATIAGQLQAIAAADGEADEEAELVGAIVERWQISG